MGAQDGLERGPPGYLLLEDAATGATDAFRGPEGCKGKDEKCTTEVGKELYVDNEQKVSWVDSVI